jgi:antitoxin CptB
MSELPRLRWLCRRGMKELDVVMTGYLDNYYTQASLSDQQSFKDLLDMPDPDLFSLLVGRDKASDENVAALVQFLTSMVSRK